MRLKVSTFSLIISHSNLCVQKLKILLFGSKFKKNVVRNSGKCDTKYKTPFIIIILHKSFCFFSSSSGFDDERTFLCSISFLYVVYKKISMIIFKIKINTSFTIVSINLKVLKTLHIAWKVMEQYFTSKISNGNELKGKCNSFNLYWNSLKKHKRQPNRMNPREKCFVFSLLKKIKNLIFLLLFEIKLNLIKKWSVFIFYFLE